MGSAKRKYAFSIVNGLIKDKGKRNDIVRGVEHLLCFFDILNLDWHIGEVYGSISNKKQNEVKRPRNILFTGPPGILPILAYAKQ